MSSSAGSAPAAPDPEKTAAAQTASNKETASWQAALNNTNQVTPYGNLTYTRSGNTPWDEQGYLAANPDVAAKIGFGEGQFRTGLDHYNAFGKNENRQGVAAGYGTPEAWTATTTLAPAEEKLLGYSNEGRDIYGRTAVEQLKTVQDTLATPFKADYSEIGDPRASRDAVEGALMGRLNPYLERERAALETRLANQGIGVGSSAWSAAFDDYNRGANDARLGVVAKAGDEQDRVLRMREGLQRLQLNERNQPITEAIALLTGAQPNSPSFAQTPSTAVGNTNVLGAYDLEASSRNNAYNAKVAQAGSQNAGMAAAGGAVASIAAAAIIA